MAATKKSVIAKIQKIMERIQPQLSLASVDFKIVNNENQRTVEEFVEGLRWLEELDKNQCAAVRDIRSKCPEKVWNMYKIMGLKSDDHREIAILNTTLKALKLATTIRQRPVLFVGVAKIVRH